MERLFAGSEFPRIGKEIDILCFADGTEAHLETEPFKKLRETYANGALKIEHENGKILFELTVRVYSRNQAVEAYDRLRHALTSCFAGTHIGTV